MMLANPVVHFRAEPATQRLLVRLREEKAVNVSAWLRQVVQQRLETEFPDFADYLANADEAPAKPNPQKTPLDETDVPEPDPNKTPIQGWRPRPLPGDWGAVLEGPEVAELPDSDQLPGTPIVVTDKRGESWTTTLTEVVDRTDNTIVVKNSGRPRS